MLKQLWQRIGSASSQQSSDELLELKDTDYEFIFAELLEGVAHGWHQGKIVKFFNQLGSYGKPKLWIDWLNRYETQLMSGSNGQQLAARMMRLGQLSQSLPSLQSFGKATYNTGEKWLALHTGTLIWEYNGPDWQPEATEASSTEPAPAPISESSSLPASPPAPVQTVTLEQLETMLQQDQNLVKTLATQLGLETNDPQAIIQALVAQTESDSKSKAAEPNSQLDSPQTVEDWFNLGLQQAQKQDLEGAITSWSRALALDPNLASAWHNRGSALAYLSRFSEAVDSFDRAIELNPQDAQAWNDRGNALFNLGQLSEAISSWTKALEFQSDLYNALYNRGLAFQQLGQYQQALADFQQVQKIEPRFELAQTKIAEIIQLIDTKK